MMDVIKMFFAGVGGLPAGLRQAFILLFFTSAVLFAVAFKRWLERRRDYRDADIWAEMPVGLAFLQVCLWGAWATAGFYAMYNDGGAATAAAKSPYGTHGGGMAAGA